jgi:dihydropteroate synthase
LIGAAVTNLRAGKHEIGLATPCVMGILNVTADSFHDGGRLDRGAALAHARRMIDDGARIVDVGGESTRPGAAPVDEREEMARVLPIVEALAAEDVCVSVDTMKPNVMRAVLDAGAAMINDVHALQAPGALPLVADSDVAVCLMHMQGEPRTMQRAPAYADVVAEVRAFLSRRAHACIDAGIGADRIVVDPGFGFGKSVAHNLELLRHLDEITTLGHPVLAGLSRKSTLGSITGRDVGDRLAGSIAAALAAVLRGARIVRVHDVRETIDALAVWSAIEPWPASDTPLRMEQ